MDNMPTEPLKDYLLAKTSRRKLLRTIGAGIVGAPFASFTFWQGQRRDGYETPRVH
jgi:hypothetical protein